MNHPISSEHTPLISLVIPVFNEEKTVEYFTEKVTRIIDKANFAFEFWFINDGSRDNTLTRLLELKRISKYPFHIVNLSRNFGKEAALTAGLDLADGDAVIPIDVDLQDPPEIIIDFIELWRQGYDIVYGVRTCRNNDSFTKRFSASLFYRIFNCFSPIKLPENAGDFRLIDKRVVEVLRRLPERNRFMKGLFTWVGFREIGVPYERCGRIAGSSKWNYWRLLNFALDGIVGFSTIPLRIWSYVGFVFSLFAFLYGLFIVTRTLVFGIEVPGYASLMTVILFLGGVQLISIGIIGEYVGRLVVESKARPIYVVDEIFRHEKREV